MAGYHAFLSDWFRLVDPNTVDPINNPNAVGGNGVDMRGWDAVAFLLMAGEGTVEMADDDTFTMNLVTPVIEVDYGRPIVTPGIAPPIGPGLTTEYPFWLEVWRPTKRYVRVQGAGAGLMAFLYRGTGLRPPTPAPFRAGGRAS
jgi:hypothetical protein